MKYRLMFLSVAVVAAITASGTAYAARRPVPEYLKSAVIYQIVLRSFTRDGNFKAATEMLDHVRSIGVDVIYLAPFVEADRDMDRSGWSPRQKKFGGGSPKNPYRISNYDKIDPEYGGDEDFKAFNDKAHALGMKVYMDIVYMHCGPNNVMKDMFPDAFQRNPDGSVRVTSFKFPYVNFESKAVRKYLIGSMLRWISLGCDGFRCDMADHVPLDFWEEAAAACRAVKPDLGMINEGSNPESLRQAFDACYAIQWSFLVRDELVKSPFNRVERFDAVGKDLHWRMDYVRAYESQIPEGGLTMCFLDNHDTAQDDCDSRFDRSLPVEAGNAGFVITFLRYGLPLVFCGNEIADTAMNCTLMPVEHPLRANKTVDWGRALQPAGQKRLSLLRRLAKLRHEMAVFSEGTQEWVTEGESKGTVAFVRRLGNVAVFVAANLTDKAVEFNVGNVRPTGDAKTLLSGNGALDSAGVCRLGPYGHVVILGETSRPPSRRRPRFPPPSRR